MKTDDAARIAVIGAGSVGGVVAAMLSERGHDVTLCVRRPIDRLVVELADRTLTPRVTIATSPERAPDGAFDWVMVATKIQDTASVTPWLEGYAKSFDALAVLQNGIDHAERFPGLVPPEALLPALVHVSAEQIAPGHVRHHTGLALVVPDGQVGQRFARLFSGSAINVELTADILTASWLKLFGNVAAAPITALTLARIGVMRHPDVRALAQGILTEAAAVGQAAGARLTPDDVTRTLDAFDRYNPAGGSSMMYDRLAGRPLEHEHLSGALVKVADRLGIPVPLNKAVLALLIGADLGIRSRLADGEAG